MEDLHSWWEVPAVAHFFSLFKSCFSLSDFTIEVSHHGCFIECLQPSPIASCAKLPHVIWLTGLDRYRCGFVNVENVLVYI